VEFKILGPLEVWDGDRLLQLGGAKRRAALALLVVNANEVVGADRFVDGLWGHAAPGNAMSALHNHISRLRKELGAELVASEGWGYALRVDPETIDLHRFERLAAEAQPLRAPERADRLAEALALWRGAPLADLTFEEGLARELARLEERRIVVLEQRIDADLEAGRSGELVGELEALIAEYPFREHLCRQLILALYRAGRQAEALEAYRDARRRLAEELGLEPTARLRELERAILSQDPALDGPAALSPRDDGEEPEAELSELPPELDPATPLFGRASELDFLTRAWRQTEKGPGGVVFLRGPPGIGKTRLAAELARAVVEEGGTVVYVPCAGALREGVERIRRAARSSARTLLVADDLDLATGTLMDSLAALLPSLAEKPFLLLGTYREETSPFLKTILDRVDPSRLHRRDLGPLNEEEIRSVASLYAGWSLAQLPLDELVQTTGGVAGLVHRSARDWAREHTSGRLSALASQTATEREGLRAAERVLEQSVADLQRLRTWSDVPATEGPAPVVCPFKGLATFEASDAEFFFGRERLVAELVARLVGTRFLVVVGESGSGKSSAVRAGLLPALAGGIIPGSGSWRQVVIRPGTSPMEALEPALEGPSRLLLVVDQLEEVFTSCDDEDERARFLAALCSPAEAQVFVLALRADFYGRCAAYPRLAELLALNHVLVAPMQEEELRRAIEFPARRAGLRVEPELVDALVADVGDEPGGLPLLSTALLELWQLRTGRTLTFDDYRNSGGVRGAVARLAEATYERLSSDQRLVARAILLRLATTDGGVDVVRRRVPLSELDADRSTDAARVVAVLTRARLLTTSEESVEVAHEALLREWPRLHAWLEEDAEARRLHGHLMRAAREWEERGRDPADLYRGARLGAALDWMSRHPADPNEAERRFLEASRDSSEREADRQRATNRRLRLLLAGVAVLLVGAVVASVFAFSLRGQARDEARIAGARELAAAADANLQVDPERSILLALEAVKSSGGAHGGVLKEAQESLEDAVATSRNVLSVPGAGRGVSFSPDGTRFASEGASGDAAVWDASTGKRVLALESGVTGVDFGSTGEVVATAGADGHATIWDAASGRRLRTVTDRSRSLVAAELGRRDTVLATVTEAGELKLWDVATGRMLLERRAWSGETIWPGAADVVAFSADGRLLAAANLGGGKVAAQVWDVDSGARLLALPANGNAANDVDLSADGSRLAVARADGAVEVRNARTGRLQATVRAHQGNVWDVELSSYGRRLATAGNDGYAKVWALGSANIRELFSLPGHNATVEQVSFSRDGTRLVSGSDDGTAKIWDVSLEGPRAVLLLPGTARVSSGGVAYSADGRRLAAPSGGAVRIWDAATGRSLRALPGAARGVSFSPDGRLIATTKGSAVQVWNASNGRRVYGATINNSCRTVELRCPVTQAVFSPDGSQLAVGSADGTARILDVRTGLERLRLATYQGPLLNVAFSSDGRRLVTAALDGTAKVWDTQNGAQLLRLGPVAQPIADVAISPDGDRVVTAGWDGLVRVWNAENGDQARSWNANQGDLFDIAFATDGRLATTGEDGGIKLWNPARGDELLSLPAAGRSAVAFSPDGKRLAASVASGRTVTVWPLGISDLVELARGRVTRSLTEEECRRYLHVGRCPGR
jgi:WD40 repeat protein/DNA-binding SARP family transcriptional activator